MIVKINEENIIDIIERVIGEDFGVLLVNMHGKQKHYRKQEMEKMLKHVFNKEILDGTCEKKDIEYLMEYIYGKIHCNVCPINKNCQELIRQDKCKRNINHYVQEGKRRT